MFKQRYKDANAQIHAPQGALAQLGQTPKRNRKAVVQWAAACLAMCMMATAAVALLLPKGPTIQTASQLTAKAVQNYDQLYELVKSAQSGTNGGRGAAIGDKSANESLTPSAQPSTQGAGNPTTTADKNYSGTNVQVDGVDEADIVKTDGGYIYRLSNNKIAIVKVDGATMSEVSSIQVGKSGESPVATEMFVYGDRLLVISQQYSWVIYSDGVKPESTMKNGGVIPPITPSEAKTYATVYDITDRSAPKKINQLTQSGSYLSSRMVGDVVYLLSNYYVNSAVQGKPETFVPKIGGETDTKPIEPANIQSFENPETASYVVVTSIAIKDAKQYGSVKAVLGSAGTVYANADSLLVAANQYAEDRSPVQKDASGKNVVTVTGSQKTKLLLFKINGGGYHRKGLGDDSGHAAQSVLHGRIRRRVPHLHHEQRVYDQDLYRRRGHLRIYQHQLECAVHARPEP